MAFENKGGKVGYTGENATFIGEFNGIKTYFAFPFGKGTQKEIEEWLDKNRARFALNKARLLPTPLYINYKKIPWE